MSHKFLFLVLSFLLLLISCNIEIDRKEAKTYEYSNKFTPIDVVNINKSHLHDFLNKHNSSDKEFKVYLCDIDKVVPQSSSSVRHTDSNGVLTKKSFDFYNFSYLPCDSEKAYSYNKFIVKTPKSKYLIASVVHLSNKKKVYSRDEGTDVISSYFLDSFKDSNEGSAVILSDFDGNQLAAHKYGRPDASATKWTPVNLKTKIVESKEEGQ